MMKFEFSSEERDFLYEEAFRRHRQNSMRVRGQAITETDGIEYWVHVCTIEAIKCPTIFFGKVKVVR